MLCPQCGTDVGESLSLCTRCSETQPAAPAGPQPSAASGSEPADLDQLYKQSLGIGQTEELIEMLTQPLPLTLIGLCGFLLIFAALMATFPELSWQVVLLRSVSTLGGITYAAVYCNILLDIFYVDRTAFFICLAGFVSVPFVAFMYKDEIGAKKLTIACSGYVVAVLFSILAFQVGGGYTPTPGMPDTGGVSYGVY